MNHSFGNFASDVRVHALASGSSGNAFLIQSRGSNILIDAGVAARTLASSLAKRGVSASQLDAILLTHEHSDHISGLGLMARRTGAPVIANRLTLTELALRVELPFQSQELATGNEIGVGSVGVRSFAVSHDAVEPVGYVLDCGGVCIAYATDLGMPTAVVREALRGAHLVVLEANHDLEWLLRGPYLPHMKERVASDVGHLSNADCAELIADRAEEGGPVAVWLAHLSRVNNSPSLARRAVQTRVAELTRTPISLDIALRDHPSVCWSPGMRAVQLSLL